MDKEQIKIKLFILRADELNKFTPEEAKKESTNKNAIKNKF